MNQVGFGRESGDFDKSGTRPFVQIVEPLDFLECQLQPGLVFDASERLIQLFPDRSLPLDEMF
jgi:hypothetical protein